MAADEKWYFTKEQLANTPSRKCGYDQDKELSYRQQAANFIQDMGQRLLVTQLCINTAIVYMHRFYVFHSFTHFHRNAMAAASLFLAAKVEEQPRKLEHVIKVAHVCLHRDQPTLDTKSEAYLEQAQDLVFNENVLLQTLGFDVAIDHPHTHVVRCCHMVKASKDLAQTSYFMASNSLHLTTMCLQYKPTVVACFCIHLACKWSNWEIPQSNEGKDWFWYVDKTVSLDQLEQLTSEFLVIFDKCPTKLKHKIKSISATQNTSMPQSISSSPFDMEPRKIRPPDGSSSSQSLDGQGPCFRPYHAHSESKPGQLPAPDDPFKKQQPNSQPAQRVDYREYREKKERERQEREKISQASGNREGHHHSHHHSHHHGQQPPHKGAALSSKGIPPAPQGQHHKPPNSAVTASRDAARREQAHARDMNRKRSEFSFGPLMRHEPPVDSQPLPSLDLPVTNHVVNSVGKKDGQDWDIESTDCSTKHGTPSDKFRDRETAVRHSQSIDPSKRSGPNFDGSVKHSSKVSSDNRSSANSSVMSSDNRVIKESVPRGTESAANLPKTESEVPVQKHLYNHNRHKTSEGQELPKRPPLPGHDVSSKRVATPPSSSIRPSKSEHRVEHPTPLKREEEVATSNGKAPVLHHHSHHSKSKDSKSPSLQQLQHRARSPAISTLASVPMPRSKSPLPAIPPVADVRSKSPSVAPTSNKTSSQTQYFTPGQGTKSSDSVPARNGTLHHATPEEKQRPPTIEKPTSPPKSVEVELPLSSPPLSTRIAQKVPTTPEKGGHSLRERESPYPQRQKRQRTPPSGKKQSLPPPPPPTVPAPDMPVPLSPASGIMSPFGSPPPPTPTTPGKVLPSGGTPASNRISTRNRTSSSSSEPELVPLVTKLDQMAGYENIIRDSRMSIKLPGPVPDIIQPIRDRKLEEGAVASGTKTQGLSVAKELKPPELIPPFSLAQPVDMGAVAFPSPAAESVTEPDANSDFNATDCTNVIDVISVTDPVQSPEKTVPDVPKSLPSIPPLTVEGKKSSSDHHHKSEKKKKKDKHKHKDKDKNREDRKKSKHKNKDKDRHKDRPETSSLASTSAPIKITIPKDKLVSLPPAPEPPSSTSTSGLKLKIQKDRLKGSESTGSSPQAVKLEPPVKIKIVKEKVEISTLPPVTSVSVKESRKRERSSPKSGADQQTSLQPPPKSARLSESQNRRSTSSYNKQNGVESRSSSGSGRGQSQPYTAGTKMVAKLADSHNSQSKGKPPTAGNQQ